MTYNSLLNDVDKAFSSFKRPLIIYSAPAGIDINKGEYLAIQHNFCSVSRAEMTYEQCSMMIIDGSLISNEALCYFLPRLVRAVIQENGNGELLYRRLEKINKNLFNQEKQILLESLITSLKEFEQEIEMEEERELNKFK